MMILPPYTLATFYFCCFSFSVFLVFLGGCAIKGQEQMTIQEANLLLSWRTQTLRSLMVVGANTVAMLGTCFDHHFGY